MRYRTPTVFAAADLVAASGTKVIDIRLQDIISRIMIYWQVTWPNTEGMNGYQHLDISKIELVDGSDVLFSMNGGQAQALNIYDRKVPTMNYKQTLSQNSCASMYGIDFGRFLQDPMFALDPKRFQNLQLKITYNEATAKTGCTANELQVMAEVFDEAVPSPRGFLMSKEHYSALSPASGYVYIDLPVDHPIRKLLIQGYYIAFEPWYTVAEARLDEDNEKKIPFDWDIERYYRMMMARWQPVEEEILCHAAAGAFYTYYKTPTDYYTIPTIMSAGGTVSGVAVNGWSRGGKIEVRGVDGLVAGTGIVRGYMPNHCLEFPFGDPQDPEDWYDVTSIKNLRLRLKAGSGGATGTQAVVLQQLRRY